MPKQNEPWIDNNLPQIDAKEVLIGLRSYANEVIKTIKNIHGVWAKPMYAVDGLMKAKMRPTVFNAKPDAASDECYILGFQSKGGLTRNLIHDAAHYGEAIADDWGNQPYVLSDGGAELSAFGAKAGQTIYFYLTPLDAAWKIEFVEGHWG